MIVIDGSMGANMAIAGSGGWVPSCAVIVRDGGIVAYGIVNNKPPNVVYSATERNAKGSLVDAVAVLRTGEPVFVDMSNGQFVTLCDMWNTPCYYCGKFHSPYDECNNSATGAD